MSKKEASFVVISKLDIEHDLTTQKSKHNGINILLEPSENLDRSQYVNSDGYLTKIGNEVLTQVLVQALIGNIHLAHQHNKIDSAKHLREIISELEKGFIENVKIDTTVLKM
jgi:hypothetical protein